MSDLMATTLLLYAIGAGSAFLVMLIVFVAGLETDFRYETRKARARRILTTLAAMFLIPPIWPLSLLWWTGVALVDLFVTAFGEED